MHPVPTTCALALIAALGTAAVALATEPTSALRVLVFTSPDHDIYVAAFDTLADFEEVKYAMEHHLTNASLHCVKEEEA